MTRKEIKKFYLSLIDNPDAQWSKTEYSTWILFSCRINNIRVECEENWKLKFSYVDPGLECYFLTLVQDIDL